MRHFIGGFALGVFVMMRYSTCFDTKNWTAKNWLFQFSTSMFALLVGASVVGTITWGLWP